MMLTVLDREVPITPADFGMSVFDLMPSIGLREATADGIRELVTEYHIRHSEQALPTFVPIAVEPSPATERFLAEFTDEDWTWEDDPRHELLTAMVEYAGIFRRGVSRTLRRITGFCRGRATALREYAEILKRALIAWVYGHGLYTPPDQGKLLPATDLYSGMGLGVQARTDQPRAVQSYLYFSEIR